MITTRRAPRTQRLLLGAFALSIFIHLFGGALWGQANRVFARFMPRPPEQHEREEEVATSDVVHLEKRTVPRPARRSRPVAQIVRPPQRQVVAVKPESKVALAAPSAAPEIAHIVKHGPLQVEHPAHAESPGAAASRTALSAAQLAHLNSQFAKTIASSHVDLATIQKRTEERPVAVRRYPMQFAGMQANLQRGEGYIEPTTVGQRIGGTVWYYTHYTYMWPDGHLEDDDIPWPFHYPVQHDLFALHVHLIPVQLPPPGFHFTRPLKPFLAHFVRSARQG